MQQPPGWGPSQPPRPPARRSVNAIVVILMALVGGFVGMFPAAIFYSLLSPAAVSVVMLAGIWVGVALGIWLGVRLGRR